MTENKKIIYIILIFLLLPFVRVNAEELNDSIALTRDNSEDRKIINDWIESYQKYFENNDFAAVEKSIGRFEANSRHSKTYFLKRIKALMHNNKTIQSEIEYVSVRKHYAKPNIYGLNFHQKINADSFSESGWFFMLWDFNGEKPAIHICTYQSDEEVAKNGVFTLGDFFIP